MPKFNNKKEKANEENRYNKETKDAIKETKEIVKNPNKYKSYNNIDELMEDLNKEDEKKNYNNK